MIPKECKRLAELYGVETKRLKEQVRRNIERFYVRIYKRGINKLEVAICDLKLGWCQVFTYDIHSR